MHIDRTLAESCCFGDLEDVEILYKPQKEHRPLFVGKIGRRGPHRLNLLVNQCPLFRRDLSIGKPFGDERAVDGVSLGPPPEMEALVAGMITGKIYSDGHEPGIQGRVASEPLPTAIGAQKTILRQCFSDIGVLDGCQKEAKYSRPVLLNDLVEVLDFHRGVIDGGSNQVRCGRLFHCTTLDVGYKPGLNRVMNYFRSLEALEKIRQFLE